MSQCQSLSIPRIGSVTVRHSRIHLPDRHGSGYEKESHEKKILEIEPPPKRLNRTSPQQDSEAEDRNWSLVELLSRSASAKSPRSTKSAAFLAPHGRGPLYRRLSKPESANYRQVPPFRNSIPKTGGPAKLWRRPDMFMSRDYPLNETHEDTDYEETCAGSEYYCPISSTGSSISWADDAIEAEQSENLAKLWHEVETVCTGGQRPEKMSDDVYEECLLWRRGFPVEASTRPSRYEHESRFESMEEFFAEIADDGDLTPTNETKTFPQSHNDLVMSMRLRHSALDQRRSANPNLNKRADYVTSWLSNCKLNVDDDPAEGHENDYDSLMTIRNEDDDEVIESTSSGQEIIESEQKTPLPSPERTPRENLLPKSGKFFTLECRSPSFRLLSCSSISRLPPATGSANSKGIEKVSSGREIEKTQTGRSWGSKPEQVSSRILDVIDEKLFDNNRQTVSVPFLPHEDKVLGRQNSGKPFMLWLFDRDSPT